MNGKDISGSGSTKFQDISASKRSRPKPKGKKERRAEPLAIPKSRAPASGKYASGRSYGDVHASGSSQVHLGDHHHHYHFQPATSLYDFEPGAAIDNHALERLLSYASSISDIAQRMMVVRNPSLIESKLPLLNEESQSDASIHDFTEDEAGLSEGVDEQEDEPFELEDIRNALPDSDSDNKSDLDDENVSISSVEEPFTQYAPEKSVENSHGGTYEQHSSYPKVLPGSLKPPAWADSHHDTQAAGAIFSTHEESDPLPPAGNDSTLLHSLTTTTTLDHNEITMWMTYGTAWTHFRGPRKLSVDTVLAMQLAAMLQRFGTAMPNNTSRLSVRSQPQQQFASWMWDPWAPSEALISLQPSPETVSSMLCDVDTVAFDRIHSMT